MAIMKRRGEYGTNGNNGTDGKNLEKFGKFHHPVNNSLQEPPPERKMWERKIAKASGCYLPFPHFPFW